MRHLGLGVLSSVIGFWLWSASGAGQPARVVAFSPEGTVKGVRQARASFSEAIVAFGDPGAKREAFDIRCSGSEIAGEARWADSKNWIYDFAADLPAGVECEFKLKASLKSVAGAALEARSFKFTTGGPAVTRSSPWNGSRVEENQAFILSLDAPVDEASVEKQAYFAVEGLGDRIGVRVLKGSERDDILNAENPVRRVRMRLRGGKVDQIQGVKAVSQPEVVVRAQRPFPPAAKIKLVWAAGIRSSSGVASAEDQTLKYEVRPEFRVSFTCERENAKADCIPFSAMGVDLSSEVPWSQAREIRLELMSGAEGGSASIAPEDTSSPSTVEETRAVSYLRFKGPFPPSATYRLTLPKNLKDDSGRPVTNASQFPLEVRTTAYPPLAKFAAPFGIIELGPDAALPVTLRKVEPVIKTSVSARVLRLASPAPGALAEWLVKLGRHDDYDRRAQSIFAAGDATQALTLPKPSGGEAFEVVGVPFAKPGFYVVELQSEMLGRALLGRAAPMYVASGALVTNLAVHFKRGRESSVAWVTSLDGGVPVSGAAVSVRDCTGKSLGAAKTDAQGLARFGALPQREAACKPGGVSYSSYARGLFVTAEKGDDFSFSHTSWSQGIESWRYRLGYGGGSGEPWLAHTVFDRTLFRAGETVHMKHFVRYHAMAGFAPVAEARRPKVAQIRHFGSGQKYELPLTWRKDGTAESTWTIPAGGKLGDYGVSLNAKTELGPKKKAGRSQSAPRAEEVDGEEGREEGGFRSDRASLGGTHWDSGSFQVEEYRVPLMDGRVRAPTEAQIAPKSVPLDLAVSYLAGGAAAGLPVQLRYTVSARGSQAFDDFDGYDFASGAVREGIQKQGMEEEDDEGDATEAPQDPATRLPLSLDRAGTARAVLDRLKPTVKQRGLVRSLNAELEYRDPNGEIQTASTSVALYPSSRLVGLKLDAGYATQDKLKFFAAVVDPAGKAVPNAEVSVDLFARKTYSHRKRLLGGFYAYDNRTETKKLGQACAGRTDARGVLGCDIKPRTSGSLYLQARVQDPDGRESVSNRSVYVYGESAGWFPQEDSDRIDLIPERKRYEPGETAAFQVKMPFKQATALVTIEREGVIDSFVRTVTSDKPVIEVPLKGNYAPNVFVSALLIRGRVGEPRPTALVDLGKPAYKLGIAELQVGWRAHELQVTVKPERETYHVREKARARIHVQNADGSPLEAGTEAVVAVVDEGLLLLKPNLSWKLLDSFMNARGYEVETSTAQSQVIGKRHFGLKALPHGGDGGKSPTRELFDTLLYWNARVPIGAGGEAEVEFPLNDSITSFRAVAVASSGLGRFGTGSGQLRSTQDLMSFASVPPVVREADRLPIEFTLRNATDQPMEVEASLKSTPALDAATSPLTGQKLKLAAGESRVVGWPITVPTGIDRLAYELELSVGGKVVDRLKAAQRVLATVPVRTYQATLLQIDQALELPVAKPARALPGQGGLRVTLQSSLLGSLDGVVDYMAAYPYTCLEQRASRAVTLRDAKLWQAVMGDLPNYLDGSGLVKFFPDMAQGSDVLTAYLLSIAEEAGWKLPDGPRELMLQGLRNFVEGKIARWSVLPASDLAIRKIAGIEALARYGQATPTQLQTFEIAPNLWPTSTVIQWWNILRKLDEVPDRAAKLQAADQILRSRLTFRGSSMGFSTENIDQLWWMMVSTDENANRLVLAALSESGWREDLPKMMRGAIHRQSMGHWLTTPANAWGRLAVEKFAARFEKQPVSGKSTARVGGGEPQSFDWKTKSKTLAFPWPGAPSSLALAHAGSGKPWVLARSQAAIPLEAPIASGYQVSRVWEPVEQKTKGRYSRGDIVRVKLELDAQADMSWVVVNDPIPAGASILGTGLGQGAGLATQGEKQKGWVRPTFQERAFDSLRSYYEWVPKGKWSIEYTIRLNQSGQMNQPPTRVEAMYSPEAFGESPNPRIDVE